MGRRKGMGRGITAVSHLPGPIHKPTEFVFSPQVDGDTVWQPCRRIGKEEVSSRERLCGGSAPECMNIAYTSSSPRMIRLYRLRSVRKIIRDSPWQRMVRKHCSVGHFFVNRCGHNLQRIRYILPAIPANDTRGCLYTFQSSDIEFTLF